MSRSALSFLVVPLVIACEPVDDRLPGPDDEFAAASCDAFADLTPTEIAAARDEASAAEVVLELGDTPYLVTLPEGERGYVMLRVGVEHSYMAMFVSERDVVEHAPGDPVERKHAVCPEQISTDYRLHVDEVADHLVTFSAEGPREVWVQVVLEEFGHDDE